MTFARGESVICDPTCGHHSTLALHGHSILAGSIADRRDRTRRDGTGRVNPVQGQAVHEQQKSGTRTGLDTLTSPTQVGITTNLPAIFNL